MQTAIDAFKESISRVRHLGGIHSAVRTITTGALDPSDIMRAQIVLAVSALDYYVHEITALGMIEVLQGTRPPTDTYKKYRVSISAIPSNPATATTWLANEIRERHSFLSFQQPDKIADAVRLFSTVKLWTRVGALMGLDAEQVKTQLKLIVDRRNKIAHEADIDPSYPGVRWPINEQDTESAVSFIERVGEAIHKTVI